MVLENIGGEEKLLIVVRRVSFSTFNRKQENFQMGSLSILQEY